MTCRLQVPPTELKPAASAAHCVRPAKHTERVDQKRARQIRAPMPDALEARPHDTTWLLCSCARLHQLPSPIAPLQSRFGLSGLESPIRHRPEIIFSLQEGRAARHPPLHHDQHVEPCCSIEPAPMPLTVIARGRRRSRYAPLAKVNPAWQYKPVLSYVRYYGHAGAGKYERAVTDGRVSRWQAMD